MIVIVVPWIPAWVNGVRTVSVQVIPTASGPVGYILFNDHIATAEQQLIDAVNTLRPQNIVDLVLDVRYNGGGLISTETGVLRDAPYGFKARFENGPGTNPEELLGAAHAGCFTMALSLTILSLKLRYG